MTPETEQKLNGFVDSWNYTGSLIGAIFGLCICGPVILLLVLGTICGLFRLFTAGDFSLLCISVPMLLVLAIAFFDDGKSLFKRTRQQPPPKLSKWEEKKKAESLYKFP
jgi:uncharacterized membrane protein YoaK (UPF0700 family)